MHRYLIKNIGNEWVVGTYKVAGYIRKVQITHPLNYKY